MYRMELALITVVGVNDLDARFIKASSIRGLQNYEIYSIKQYLIGFYIAFKF